MILFHKHISLAEKAFTKHSQVKSCNLFMLVERANVYNTWDLVVAAQFRVPKTQRAALNFIFTVLKSYLTKEELVLLARVVFLDPKNPFVKAITSAFNVSNGFTEINNSEINGVSIHHGYLFHAEQTKTAVKSRSAVLKSRNQSIQKH